MAGPTFLVLAIIPAPLRTFKNKNDHNDNKKCCSQELPQYLLVKGLLHL